MLIRTFVARKIKKRTFLPIKKLLITPQKKLLPVITQVYAESKLWIHLNLQQPNFCFTYPFKVYLHLVYIEDIKNFWEQNTKASCLHNR